MIYMQTKYIMYYICNVIATHCNPLQHTATHCIQARRPSRLAVVVSRHIHCNTTLQLAVTNNTLQHSDTLQHTATLCKMTLSLSYCCISTHTLQHNSATHYNTLQHTATHCNTLQHTADKRDDLLAQPLLYLDTRTATQHCNTLQHTVTPVTHCRQTR